MNEELYRLVSLSNRYDLNEYEALGILNQGVLVIARQILDISRVTGSSVVVKYLKLSYHSLKLLQNDLILVQNSLIKNEEVSLTTKVIEVPQWEEVYEQNSAQIIALIDKLNEVFNIMYDIIETYLTMKSYAFVIKENLQQIMNVLSVIAIGL